ncbi:adhesion G protein-coupled receptor E1-like [Amphiura filiformis]|uniref:adhesion G protein-coupled receptor E1-like n=1 Tax=Amphiura filiformis TaxID=82378 RepID=UPI003B211839
MIGVGWLVGFLGNLHINIAYIFDILSSLQGVYLVVVTCIINSEVRMALKREWTRKNGQVGQVRTIQVQPRQETQDTNG